MPDTAIQAENCLFRNTVSPPAVTLAMAIQRQFTQFIELMEFLWFSLQPQ